MKTLKELREEMQALHDRVDAIVAIATDEKRDLLAEEQAEVDSIQGIGDKPGKIDSVQSAINRMEKIEARQKQIVAERTRQVIDTTRIGDDGANADGSKRIVIPATAKRHGQLKCFSGPDAGLHAYTAGKVLQAVLGRDELRENARQWCNDHSVDIRAASQVEGDNTLGGVFVTPEMESGMIKLLEEYGVFRRECGTIPMGSDQRTVNKRLTGVTVYFVGEGATITESSASWGKVNLLAKKLAGLTSISSELNEDSLISVADQMTQEFAYALAVREDQCGFIGNGSSTYGGITGLQQTVTGAAGVNDAASGNTTFATLDLEDFRKTQKLLSDFPGMMPKWYIHKKGWSDSIDRLMLALSGNATTEIINGTPQTMFLGSPVVFVNAMPSTDAVSTVQVLYGDISMSARMGVRRGITIAADTSIGFKEDEIYIRVTERFAINCHETSGTIAGLKTAAS